MITEEQFIRLFVKHETELRAFALTLMLQSMEAEDLLQEACIMMWKKIDTLENEQAYRSWAYSYVRFTALNRRRKQNRSPLVFSDEMISMMAAEGVEEEELAAAEFEALAGCLDKLDGRQKDLVSRYYASPQVTAADLSVALDRPIAGLYKALERVRGTLRTCIEGRLRTEGF